MNIKNGKPSYLNDLQANTKQIQIASSFLKLHLLPQKEAEPFKERLLRSLEAHAFKFRPGTWRNRRNALAYCFRIEQLNQYQDLAVDVHRLKNPVTTNEEIKSLIPKKQTRTHKVFDEEHEKVVSYLEAIDDKSVLGAVTIARTLGIRPSEMASMKFDDSEEKIFVKGAKKREAGDRGIDRTLLLERNEYLLIKTAWTQLMAEFNRKDAKPERAMKRIQNRFYKQVRKIFTKRKSYPSLYSYRHQFGSDLKASGMDRITMAAIMGHASVESINSYGNKRHGGRTLNIQVSDESLDAVKKIKASSPPLKIPNNQPKQKEPSSKEHKTSTIQENTIIHDDSKGLPSLNEDRTSNFKNNRPPALVKPERDSNIMKSRKVYL